MAHTTTQPCTVMKSFAMMDEFISIPMPGMLKIISTRMEPAMAAPSPLPTMVTMGISAFLSTWRVMTFPSAMPLDRAVRT